MYLLCLPYPKTYSPNSYTGTDTYHNGSDANCHLHVLFTYLWFTEWHCQQL